MNEEVMDASELDFFEDSDLDEEFLDSEETSQQDLSNDDDDHLNQENDRIEDNNEDNEDFTTEVLRLKGISDPSKIKFEDESGAIVEKDWNDLNKNEQLRILTQEGNPETDLEDDEIELINTIRTSNMSIPEFINAIQQNTAKQVQEYINANTTPKYTIDEYSDDELYAYDLVEKVGGEENITEEELLDAIEKAKENPELYQKTVNGLREQYKSMEEQSIQDQQNQAQAYVEQAYNEFKDTILDQISGLDQILGQQTMLTTDDMNDLANYTLTRDESGLTQFAKDMNDPKKFVEAASLFYNREAIAQEINQQIQEAYRRGFTDGGKNKPQSNKLFIQKPSKSKYSNNSKTFDFDDESYLYN